MGPAGPQGPQGPEGVGEAGLNSLVVIRPLGVGSPPCPAGGEEIDVGLDVNGDGVLEASEITQTANVCNGVSTTPAPEAGDDAGVAEAGYDAASVPVMTFSVPYSSDGSAAASPATAALALSTKVTKCDVAVLVDTTGSMTGELANLRSSSVTTTSALSALVPDLALGVAAHADFPLLGYGSLGDQPFYFPGTATTPLLGQVSPQLTAFQSALGALVIGGGNDLPESQIPAMMAMLSGGALTWPGGSVGPFPATPSTFGAMQFRNDAFTVVAELTDAPMHNGKRAVPGQPPGTYDTVFQNPYSFPAPDADTLVSAFNSAAAKFIGIAADNGGRAAGGPGGDPYDYQAYLADQTGSLVPPSVFQSPFFFGTAGQCATGAPGQPVSPDGPGGTCRLVFSADVTGTAVSTQLVNGVAAAIAGSAFNVRAEALNDPSSSIDVVSTFVASVLPVPAGGTDALTGAICAPFDASQLAANGTINQALAASTYCFTVAPRPNTTIAPGPAPQLFSAWIRVVADRPAGSPIVLGPPRQVTFVVPAR